MAATAAALSGQFGRFSHVGGIIGTSVSAAFLIVLALINAYILYKLVKQMKGLLRKGSEEESGDLLDISGAGCLFQLLRGVVKVVDRPWKMYPLGILFGLGFDTSSEIALLGIASIQAAKGTSIWLILIFPILFTAGMCLLDTTDGALMSALYTSSSFAQDQIAILYYSIVLTIITVIVAIVVGTIQLLSLILHVTEPTGRFWDDVRAAGDAYDIIGVCIIATFVVFGTLSVFVYRPWRRRVDKRRAVDRPEIPGLETADEERTGDGPAVEGGHMSETTVQEDLDAQKPTARMS